MGVKELIEEEFNEKVVNAKGKIVVDCYAPWCGPCRMLSPIIDEIAEEMDGYGFYKINVDDAKSIMRNYQIMSIPTILIFEDGVLIKKEIGFKSKNELITLIK